MSALGTKQEHIVAQQVVVIENAADDLPASSAPPPLTRTGHNTAQRITDSTSGLLALPTFLLPHAAVWFEGAFTT
jgi:hypothetical protein